MRIPVDHPSPLLLSLMTASCVVIPSSVHLGARSSSAASPSSSPSLFASAAFSTPPRRLRMPNHRDRASSSSSSCAAFRPLASASAGGDDRGTTTDRISSSSSSSSSSEEDEDHDAVPPPPSSSSSSSPSSSSSSSTSFWRARRDCWRPDVRDVERISWGMPAKKKGTGSRGVPHRLNDIERQTFDRARRDGYLQVVGSAYRSQRRDAPLLNSYRSLMDARGRPMAVLHKLGPNSSSSSSSSGSNEDDRIDRLVVDLSPLRLPEEFLSVGGELRDRVLEEFGVGVRTDEGSEEIGEELDSADGIVLDDEDARSGGASEEGGDVDGEDDWGTRPIYQLSPHYLSWGVSRQEGKKIGKYLGKLFDNVEERGHDTKTKPKGVKPGKGRRHGGYGIG